MNCSSVPVLLSESLLLGWLQREALQLALHGVTAHGHGQNDFASPRPWEKPWIPLEDAEKIWRLPKIWGYPEKWRVYTCLYSKFPRTYGRFGGTRVFGNHHI